MLRIACLLAALCLAAGTAGARDACRAEGPTGLQHRSPALQALLARGLRGAGLGPALDRRHLTVALVDLSRRHEIFYAGINDDLMLYAASLPKIGILLSVLESVQKGEIEWDESFRFKLRKMITISNNAYATWGAKLVGLRPMARILLDPRYCLYEPGIGGLWVGRAFEKGGESYRDPLKSISHGASARQAARFYVLLDRERLVSPYWSRYMLRLMAPPDYVHKFVKALSGRPRLEFVARSAREAREEKERHRREGPGEKAGDFHGRLLEHLVRRCIEPARGLASHVGAAHPWTGPHLRVFIVVADPLCQRRA